MKNGKNAMDFKKKLKILYIINSLDIGGAENLLCHVLKEIVKRQANITLCTLYGKGKPDEKLVSEGIKIHDLSLKNKYSIKAAVSLSHLYKQGRFDVVHAHLFPSGYYAALASMIFKPKLLIYTEHSISNRRRNYRLIHPLEKFIYNHFNAIIAVGDIVKEELIKWLPAIESRIKIIPNAIPVGNSRPSERKDIDILFVGRLITDKGVDFLLKALAKIEGNYNTWIVGDGPERKNLEALASGLGIKSRVNFAGMRSDIKDLMNRAKIFVLPSRREGISLALLEAMSSGLPAVASAIGGNKEVITHGEDGLLITPEDIMQLSFSIRGLLEDDGLRQRLSIKAKWEIEEKYSIGQHIDKLMNVYRN